MKKILVAILITVAAAQCQAIFWRDNQSYLNTRFQNNDLAYEPVLRYESKQSLNPLNNNTMSRDYTTEIFEHRIRGRKVESRKIGTYPGWTLEGSLYRTGDLLIAIRGLNDNLGE
ncbi:MAG: hypothetical protein KDK39_06040, partial [Leptospiraceae bacterium]|nr:hypothetical protein [Leptospiraceae bacterium]